MESAMSSKTELMKLKKDQLADLVISLEEKIEKLSNKAKPITVKADQDRKVKVSCSVVITKDNPNTGKSYEAKCGNAVEMSLIEARDHGNTADCGQHN